MQRFMGLILLSGLYKIVGLLLLVGGLLAGFVPVIGGMVRIPTAQIDAIGQFLLYILVGSSLYGLGLLINVLLSIEKSLRVMRETFERSNERARSKQEHS